MRSRRVALLLMSALLAACSGGKSGSSIGYAGGDPARDKLRAAGAALLRVATTLADGVAPPVCTAMGLDADHDLAIGRNPLDVDACLQLVGGLPAYLIQRLSSKEDYFTLTDEEQPTVGFADAVPMGKIHFTRKGVLALSEPLVWALVAHELIHTRPTGTYFPSSLGDERSESSERFISAAAGAIASVAVLLNGWDRQPNVYVFDSNGRPFLSLDRPTVVDVQTVDIVGDTSSELILALGDEGAEILDGQFGASIASVKGRHADSVTMFRTSAGRYLVVGDATRNDGLRLYQTDGTLVASKPDPVPFVRAFFDTVAGLVGNGSIRAYFSDGIPGNATSIAEGTHYRQLARPALVPGTTKRLVGFDNRPEFPDSVAAVYLGGAVFPFPRDYSKIGNTASDMLLPPPGASSDPWAVALPKGDGNPAPVYLFNRTELAIADAPGDIRGLGAVSHVFPGGARAAFPVFVRDRNVIIWNPKEQKPHAILPVPGMTHATAGLLRGEWVVVLFRRAP